MGRLGGPAGADAPALHLEPPTRREWKVRDASASDGAEGVQRLHAGMPWQQQDLPACRACSHVRDAEEGDAQASAEADSAPHIRA